MDKILQTGTYISAAVTGVVTYFAQVSGGIYDYIVGNDFAALIAVVAAIVTIIFAVSGIILRSLKCRSEKLSIRLAKKQEEKADLEIERIKRELKTKK